jgi:excisionase family DNA binding protein
MSVHDGDSVTRIKVEDAAKLLGLSENAIRKRIERGSIKSEKVGDTRYVILSDTDMPRRDTDMSLESSALISEMRSRIEFLEDELRRKDTILMTLVQRVPELEPVPEFRESPVTAAGGPEGGEASPDGEKRSWWRRFFDL